MLCYVAILVLSRRFECTRSVVIDFLPIRVILGKEQFIIFRLEFYTGYS